MKNPSNVQRTGKTVRPMNTHDVGLHVTSHPVNKAPPTGGPVVGQVAPHFHNARASTANPARAAKKVM